MKYKEALSKHNLTPETVSKAIRDRIAELNESVELENEIREGIKNNEYEPSDLKEAEKQLKNLEKFNNAEDEKLFKAIDGYLAKVERARTMGNNMKKQPAVVKEQPKPVETAPAVETPAPVVEPVNTPVAVKVEEQPIEVVAEEIEEPKKKKGSGGLLLLLGIGAAILTFGLVGVNNKD